MTHTSNTSSGAAAPLPGSYHGVDVDDGKAYRLVSEDELRAWQARATLATQPAAPAEVVAPWTDAKGNPIRHGDTLRHPVDGSTFVAVRLPGYPSESDAWRAVYDGESTPSRLCLQIGDKGCAVNVLASPAQAPAAPSVGEPDPLTLCPWCGMKGANFDESPRPVDYCQHDSQPEAVCNCGVTCEDRRDGCRYVLADKNRATPPAAPAATEAPSDEGWSGWACQYPGRLPRLYGARHIAEVNLDEENGDRLLFVKEVPHD